jgi:hypothetical protein
MKEDLQKIYDEETNPKMNIDNRFYKLADIISDIPVYEKLVDKICYTSDWNFTDLYSISMYIAKNNIDMYSTLKILAEDYRWAANKSVPGEIGNTDIASTAIMILGDLHYEFNNDVDRTQEVQTIINGIEIIESYTYREYYKRAIDNIIQYFKKSIERQLTWGLKIF